MTDVMVCCPCGLLATDVVLVEGDDGELQERPGESYLDRLLGQGARFCDQGDLYCSVCNHVVNVVMDDGEVVT